MPARASYRSWSPISNRRCSSTPHPDSNRGLSSQNHRAQLSWTPLLPRRAFWAEPAAGRDRSACSETSSCKKLHKKTCLETLAPKTPPSAPTHPGRRRRTVRHIPGHRSRRKNPFHQKEESAAAAETPQKHERAARGRSASASHRSQPRSSSSRRTARPAPAKKPRAAPTARGRQKPL